jgi:hypothetical protein
MTLPDVRSLPLADGRNFPKHIVGVDPCLMDLQISSTGQNELRLSVSEFASLLGIEEGVLRERITRGQAEQEYFSIAELAERWRCSRGTVYNRLRAVGAAVLDFGAPGKKCRKAVAAKIVLQIESRKTKRLK